MAAVLEQLASKGVVLKEDVKAGRVDKGKASDEIMALAGGTMDDAAVKTALKQAEAIRDRLRGKPGAFLPNGSESVLH